MALGAGLDVLFEDNSFESKNTQTLRMSEIEPNKSQPRTVFDEEDIRGLADSIREHGLIQPIVVRPLPNGMTYRIIAGERRWRACKMLGMDEVSVIIRDADELEAAQLAVVENVQRSDLNPVDEASAYRALMDNYGMTQDKLAAALGKSRSYIANLTRLLSLPQRALEALGAGDISIGHAKALLSIEDEGKLLETMDAVIKEKLSVRQTEKLAAAICAEEEDKPAPKKNTSYFTEMELSLRERLGRSVKISGSGDRGKITVSFSSREDLSELADMLVRLDSREREYNTDATD